LKGTQRKFQGGLWANPGAFTDYCVLRFSSSFQPIINHGKPPALPGDSQSLTFAG